MAKKSFILPLKAKVDKYERGEGNKPQTLSYEDPIDGKTIFLRNNPKFEDDFILESDYILPFVKDDHKWLFCTFKGGVVDNLFSIQFITNGNEDVSRTKKYLEDWLLNGCFGLICVDGQETLEVIVDKLQGRAFTYNGKIPQKPPQQLAAALDELCDNFDAGKHDGRSSSATFLSFGMFSPVFWESEHQVQSNARNFIEIPEPTGEYPKSLGIEIELPEIKESSGQRRQYSGGAKPYTGQDRLKDVCGMLIGKEADQFNELYDVGAAEPDKLKLALLICGVTTPIDFHLEVYTRPTESKEEEDKPTVIKGDPLSPVSIPVGALKNLFDEYPEEFEETTGYLAKIQAQTEDFESPFKVGKSKTSQSQGMYLTNLNKLLEYDYNGVNYPHIKYKSYLIGLGATKDSLLQETPSKVAQFATQIDLDL